MRSYYVKQPNSELANIVLAFIMFAGLLGFFLGLMACGLGAEELRYERAAWAWVALVIGAIAGDRMD